MRKLMVFETVTANGLFAGPGGDLGWAFDDDPEFAEFTAANASEPGVLLLGRRTFEQMAAYWPTPMAAEASPAVAEGMNAAEKIVFSRTLRSSDWVNTRVVAEDPCEVVGRMKQQAGRDLVVLGSGSVVAQLAGAGLVDRLQLVVRPVILAGGRTPFEGLGRDLPLRLTDARVFRNGNVVLTYAPGS